MMSLANICLRSDTCQRAGYRDDPEVNSFFRVNLKFSVRFHIFCFKNIRRDYERFFGKSEEPFPKDTVGQLLVGNLVLTTELKT